MGAYIIAANDGVVISSTYSTSGYGNMIIIDHGGGVATLYGHGSERLVEVRTNSKTRRLYNESWFNPDGQQVHIYILKLELMEKQ